MLDENPNPEKGVRVIATSTGSTGNAEIELPSAGYEINGVQGTGVLYSFAAPANFVLTRTGSALVEVTDGTVDLKALLGFSLKILAGQSVHVKETSLTQIEITNVVGTPILEVLGYGKTIEFNIENSVISLTKDPQDGSLNLSVSEGQVSVVSNGAVQQVGAGQGMVVIDKTPPSLAPDVSPNPALLNGDAAASPNASDSGSGVLSASCGPVNTASIGAKTVNCQATDVDGNTATASVPYTVLYGFSGFFSPVDNAPTMNVAKAGQSIPIKWRLTDANGIPITNLTSATVNMIGIPCDAGTTTDSIEEYAINGNGFQNLGNGNYLFTLKHRNLSLILARL